LKENKKRCQSQFHICTHPIHNQQYLYFITHDLGSYVTNKKPTEINFQKIKTISSKKFFSKYNLRFNVLIVDCEGCLCDFLKENEFLLNQLELIVFEKDNETKCNYEQIYEKLKKYHFVLVEELLNHFQQVWIKKKI
jgi:hypothetical protein